MKVIIALVLLFCITIPVFGRYGHHQHHKAPSDSQCHFETDKGSYDLRLLVRDLSNKDLELKNSILKASFFYNPCGSVHNEQCPKGSALCEVTEEGQVIDFGQADNLTWAEGQDVGVELVYGNGQDCGNGVPRKTVVQLTCSRPTEDKQTHRTVITNFVLDGCVATLSVSSPYGCPIEELCTVYDQNECEASEGLCAWKDDSCVYTSKSCVQLGKHHIPMLTFIALAFGCTLAGFFCCSACVCACRNRRRRRLQKSTLPVTKKAKKSKKPKKTAPVEEVQEMQMQDLQPQFIYQPLQQYPGQQYPGQGYAFPVFVPSTTVQNE